MHGQQDIKIIADFSEIHNKKKTSTFKHTA